MSIGDYYRNIKWFIRNVWYFRKELMEFRSWDFAFAYYLFNRGLLDIRNQIETQKRHVDWETQVALIKQTLTYWDMYENAFDYLGKDVDAVTFFDWKAERWEDYHDNLKEYSAGWWE